MSTKSEATVEDLYDVPKNGNAEILGGETVLMNPPVIVDALCAGVTQGPLAFRRGLSV